MFKSIDELSGFSFEDCVLSKVEKEDDRILFHVEALIVKARNSQNENCTDSYSGSTVIEFTEGKFLGLTKCGYRYYNADGVLLREVPDEEVLQESVDSLIKSFEGSYLVEVTLENGVYTLEIETVDEEGSVSFSYLYKVKASSFVVSWERYLNRVQR